jgi:uncharacterized protein YdeI (YjbR/CyaY-like superfamily)
MAHLEPYDIAWFASPEELRSWLAEHHATAAERWIGMRKKASGIQSVTWEQVVDEVLCVGWIDGVRMPADGDSCIRITPRRPGSIWSARNVGRVAALRAEGRMQPAGEVAHALRREDRTAVYSFEQEGRLDDDARAALETAGGLAFFEAQPLSYRKMASGWVASAKRPDTRARRLAEVAEASAAGVRAPSLAPVARSVSRSDARGSAPRDDTGSG